jgi:Domain of unknown function (DUF4203)
MMCGQDIAALDAPLGPFARRLSAAMESWVLGIVLAVIGVLACFWGMQLWYVLLPLLAGLFGFYIGARALQEWLGTGFLATTFSWLFGIILAFAFAGLSWWFWSLGMAFVAAAAGALLASGLLHALFPEPWGWVLLLVTGIGALVGAVLSLTLHLPSHIVVIASAFVGAAMAVAGVMTLFGIITVEELANGVAIAIVDEAKYQGASWLWVLGWIALALVGLVVQYQHIAEARLPEERWARGRTM